MENQSRLLLILRYLYDRSDADHDVSSKDMPVHRNQRIMSLFLHGISIL